MKGHVAAPQMPKIKSSQGNGRLGKIKKFEKYKKDSKLVTNKDANNNKQKALAKVLERAPTEFN